MTIHDKENCVLCVCKICGHNLSHGDCGNCHTFCTWCGYHDGIDGEYIPEWNDKLEKERNDLENRFEYT